MAKSQELPEDPKGRAIHVMLDDGTYGRLQALCGAHYRNVPHMVKWLIDREFYEDQAALRYTTGNTSTPTTVE